MAVLTRFLVFQVLIGSFGADIVGSTATGIAFLATVGCPIKTIPVAFKVDTRAVRDSFFI
jgi:hypothetical protein